MNARTGGRVSLRRWVVAAAAGMVAIVLGAAGAQAAPGNLAPSFGHGGIVISDLGNSSEDSGYAVAFQKDQKIVVAGESFGGVSDDFAVARYGPSGGLNKSFGDGGVVITDLYGSSDDTAYAVTVQKDQKIVAAGESDEGDGRDFSLARYKKNGHLDKSFGEGGKVTTDIGSSSDESIYGMAIQKDGKIVVAGRSDANGSYDFAVARYLENGDPDTGFGTGGVVTTDLSTLSEDTTLSVALGTGGTILAAGSSNANGDFDFALARYDQNGDPDTGFGSGGVVFTDISGSNDDALRAVAIQKNDKIVAAGETERATEDFALARYAGP